MKKESPWLYPGAINSSLPKRPVLIISNLGLLLEVALNPMEDDVSTILREAVEASRQTLLFINDQLDSNEE